MPRFVIISDTHNAHDQLEVPDGDFLIHCGDMTNIGDTVSLKLFFDWFSDQPHKYKLCIYGNHDNLRKRHMMLGTAEFDRPGVQILFDEYLEIDGIKIYGTPWVWDAPPNAWNDIPDETQLLITHPPPHGILDQVPSGEFSFEGELLESMGSIKLLNRMRDLSHLRLHCFGHCHEQGGRIFRDYEGRGLTLVNAACMNNEMEIINKPVVLDLDF